MINTIPNKTPEIYREHKDKEVRIILINGNTDRLGVFERYDGEHIYLRPCLIHEPLVDKNGDTIKNSRIEKERPLPIRKDLIALIDPLSKGYIKKFSESINSSNKDYSPKDNKD